MGKGFRAAWLGVAAAMIASPVLGACGLADGLQAQDRRAVANQSFAFVGRVLTIIASDVTVRVDPGATSSVSVKSTLTGKAVDTGNSTKEFKNGTLRLGIRCSGVSVSCAGRYDVRVPPGVALVVRGNGADVHVKGTKAGVNASLHDGNLRLESLSGRLVLANDGGSITSTQTFSSAVSAVSTNGSVRLSFAAHPTGVTASSDTGGLDIAVPAGKETYHVETVSRTGGVKSTVPNTAKAPRSLTVKSADGSIRIHRTGS